MIEPPPKFVESQRRCKHTFPTAASPSNTSLTLLLGFGAVVFPESAILW